MDFTIILGWILVTAGAFCWWRALRIDRQLRGLLPTVIERRWQMSSPASDQLIPDFEFGPARWQRRLHSERGAALVDRFFLFVALAWCCSAPGVMLMAPLQ